MAEASPKCRLISPGRPVDYGGVGNVPAGRRL